MGVCPRMRFGAFGVCVCATSKAHAMWGFWLVPVVCLFGFGAACGEPGPCWGLAASIECNLSLCKRTREGENTHTFDKPPFIHPHL